MAADDWLWWHFKPASENLFGLQSSDGVTWSARTCNYTPTSGHVVRDPNVVQWNGKYWLVHTNITGAASTSNSFDLAVSDDGITFTFQQSVSVADVVSGSGARAWGPRWVLPETANDTTLRVMICLTSGGSAGDFQPYILTPTDQSGLTTWSGCTQVTGSDFPVAIFDTDLVRVGNIYYLFYKNEQGGKFIEVSQSSSPFSGFAQVKTGDWAGWGTPREGNYLVEKPNGKWRIYLDLEGAGYRYSDSATASIVGSWSAILSPSVPYTPQNGRVFLKSAHVPAPSKRYFRLK